MKNEAVIRHRLDLYYEQTGAVVGGYAGRGTLFEVDGGGGSGSVKGTGMSRRSVLQPLGYEASRRPGDRCGGKCSNFRGMVWVGQRPPIPVTMSRNLVTESVYSRWLPDTSEQPSPPTANVGPC
jgi:hypothetical protein